MRKFLLFATLAVVAIVSGGIFAQAQPYGPGMMGYGPGGYGQGYGPGWMMSPGYGHSWMMGGGYGPGMMGYGYGYGSDERGYGRGPHYRGERLCWRGSHSASGYYAPCRN
jgi:hypothetical protein